MFINFKPLVKYSDYRYLFIGQTINFFGSMISYVAVPYQVYELSKSTFLVGLLGAVQLGPVLIFGLLGGSVADRLDRRRMVIIAELIMGLASLLLMANALLPQPSVVAIFALVFVMQAAGAYHRPAMEAMSQKMVDKQDYGAVGALNSLRSSAAMILGPALGGWLIAHRGVFETYMFDAISFVLSLLCVWRISQSYQAEGVSEKHDVLKDIRDGIHFARTKQSLIGTYLIDIAAMTFAFPLALYPALAEKWGGASVLGWLYSGMAMGSLVISIFSGWFGKSLRRGRMVIVAASLWGLAIIGFGYAHSFLYAMIFLGLAGAADMVSGLYRGIIWNEVIPNNMRGRLAGIEMISYMSGPLLGNFRAGTLASWTGLETAVSSGGMICVVAVVLCALFLPQFWKYTPAEA